MTTNAVQRRIDDLLSYLPPLTARPDLWTFWEETVRQARRRPFGGYREKEKTPFPYMEVHKVAFAGFDDTPIHGWFVLPAFADRQRLPCAVMLHGYAGNKGLPEDYAAWVLMGMAVFAVDIRGQGGETGNLLDQRFGMSAGWITQGILDKDRCYYRAITVDCLRAIDWVAEQPEIDAAKIAVVGGSQGGGLALMMSALSDKLTAAVANVPNMCHMDYGLLHSTGSLTEAASFVSRYPDTLDRVLETLSYFDVMNLAERIRIPVLVSVSLKDTVCMPETVFAAYNRIRSEKHLHVFPFNGHSLGGGHLRTMIEFVAGKLGIARP